MAIASVQSCTGDWFGATGYDEADPDRFIAPDLQGGRLPWVLAHKRPCILLGHWPCFYANDGIGFRVLREVKRRLDAYDPDGTRTVWMKTSEIAHYWMARELTDIAVATGPRAGEWQVRLATRFPANGFTLSLDRAVRTAQVGPESLRQVHSRRDLRRGTFLTEGRQTYLAFDLVDGETCLTVQV